MLGLVWDHFNKYSDPWSFVHNTLHWNKQSFSVYFKDIITEVAYNTLKESFKSNALDTFQLNAEKTYEHLNETILEKYYLFLLCL
jgi:hypothetical protein